ncbi:MAG: serpin family protein [Akkermansia sp.]|nr:serpin family protein [Akkermansia sp.]
MNKMHQLMVAVVGVLSSAVADTAGMSVFRSMVAENQGNVACSPAMAEELLSSLTDYSAGVTHHTLSQVNLGKRTAAPAMQVQQASALFASPHITLNPGFNGVQTLDFQFPDKAADTINTWCHEHTHGLIPAIVQPADLEPNMAFVAANAIYLHEHWLYPFDAADTVEGIFNTADGKRAHMPIMNIENKFAMAKGADWQAVALPYDTEGREGEPGYFIGILPVGQSARDFAATLTHEKVAEIRKALAETPVDTICVQLPRFTVSTPAMDLRPAFEKLGLNELFTQADFSSLVQDAPGALYLSRVTQKCYVNVDEQGTKAAAAGAAFVRSKSLLRRICFDRPFVWMITELNEQSTPWFIGLYEKP